MNRLFAVLTYVALATCGYAADSSAPPTFAHEIAPIIYSNCAACHRPGGSRTVFSADL